MDSFSQTFFLKNTSNIKKRDLKDLKEFARSMQLKFIVIAYLF